MACKNLDKRLTQKIVAIVLLLAGLFLLSYSHSLYVEEKAIDQDESFDESVMVNVLDATAGICIAMSFVLNITGLFAGNRQSKRGKST